MSYPNGPQGPYGSGPHPPQGPYGPGPYPPQGPYGPSPSNTLSVVGIVLGAVAFLFCPPLFGIAGIICGAVANSKGERLASTALGVSIAGLVGGMILGYLFFQGMYGG